MNEHTMFLVCSHWVIHLPACHTSIGVLTDCSPIWWQPVITSPVIQQMNHEKEPQTVVLALLGLISVVYWLAKLDDWMLPYPIVQCLWFQQKQQNGGDSQQDWLVAERVNHGALTISMSHWRAPLEWNSCLSLFHHLLDDCEGDQWLPPNGTSVLQPR